MEILDPQHRPCDSCKSPQAFHDINNMLAVIYLNTELLLAKSHARKNQEENQKGYRSILDACQNAIGIIARITRPHQSTPCQNLGEEIQKAIALASLITKGICKASSTKISDSPLAPFCRESFQEILHNLIKNAAEAIQTSPPENPEIVINLKEEALHFLVEIHDNGPGISKEKQESLSSGKPQSEKGHGRGLGLASCQTLCQKEGGKLLLLHSEPGNTTFQIQIPKAQAIDPNKKTILVIEDEPNVAQLLEKFLQMEKFQTILTKSPTEGIALLEANQAILHAVLCDHGLKSPQSHDTGLNLTQEAKNRGIPTPIILMSGERPPNLPPTQRFLQKPFGMKELKQAIEEARPSLVP